MVRHPFNRLVSAYRDKLERYKGENLETDYFYKNFGRNMVKKQREKALEWLGDDFFSEENNFGAPVPVDDGWRHSPEQPCFWEFVQVVLSGFRNIHWNPTSTYCSVCGLEYNTIVKFEHLEFESQFVEQLIDPNHVADQRLTHANPTLPSGMTQDELTKVYFQQLSAEDVEALYEFYKLDFRMFGYTFVYRGKEYPH